MKKIIKDIKNNPWGWLALVVLVAVWSYSFIIPTSPKGDPENISPDVSSNFLLFMILCTLVIVLATRKSDK